MDEKELKVKEDEHGNKILIETRSRILDEEMIRSELGQIAVNKKNIETQVRFYQEKYKELLQMEEVYNKELAKMIQPEDDKGEDLFQLG